MPAKRRQRPHGQQPAGWKFRDGRPRWEPSPTLRRAGWKGRDLKDAAGGWLSRGASIDAADAICAAVAGWRAGQPVPAAFAAFAPGGAAFAGDGLLSPGQPDRFSLGVLIDAYLLDVQARKSAGTVRDYRGKLSRLLDAFAGYAALPDRKDEKGQADRKAAVALVRSTLIFTWAPYEDPRLGLVDPWTAAYEALLKSAGVNQAYGVMATAGAFLSWVRQRKTRKVANWANEVQRRTPDGRIVVWEWPEVAALVAAADGMGLPSIGDAIVLALDLGWSQVDVLKLTWGQLIDGRFHASRQKTGRKGGTPVLSLGQARLAKIRARQQAGAVIPLHVVICERTGRPWKGDHFRHLFAEVRAAAAAASPDSAAAILSKQFGDLRDTHFSWGREAGLSDPQMASRTLQSVKNIANLGDKHYGEIGVDVADQGAVLMNRLLASKGVRL